VSFKEALVAARTVLREKYAGMIWSTPEQIALADKAEWSDEDYRTAKAYMDDDNYANSIAAQTGSTSAKAASAVAVS
jgi:hypothetical protein